MSGDIYLNNVIKKYAVNISNAQNAGQLMYPILQRWGNGYMVKAEFSGSLSKGTAISIGTDADIFLSMSSSTPGTLADLYNTLHNAISQAGYETRRQNVSIGTTVNGYKVDLVPARRQSQYGNDHSLYLRKAASYTKTNINTHITYVANSNRLSEIKLAKIWCQLHQLDFPSFYLEMSVIDSLKYARSGNISTNFLTVLEFISNNLTATQYVDPANTNNIISNDLTYSEKLTIANKAKLSRSQKNWGSIVW
ncbi:MAG: nucleotidyltransferase [Proteobacteria bacterium]|nr:nucleotidyltransferase [Pseudomonadota bacterium]